MTERDELLAERDRLIAENDAVRGWGAAVGARFERIKGIDRKLDSLASAPVAGEAVPFAMLGGIHGVTLMRHIEMMRPSAREQYHTPLYAHPPQAPALPGVDRIPPHLNWMIGKGRTRADEPLYGVQLLDPESGIDVGHAEHDDLEQAITTAVALLSRAQEG